MVRSYSSRYIGVIFALCYLSCATGILWLTAVFSSNIAMAGTLVSVTPTSCPQLPPLSEGKIRNARGEIKSISGQTLQITSKKSSTPISAAYSSTTRIRERVPVTDPPASALLKNAQVSIQATPNPDGTFTATSITIDDEKGNKDDCFARKPDTNPSRALPSPASSPAFRFFDDRRCFSSALSGVATPPSGTKRTTCLAMGTIAQLQGNTLTITDRLQKSHPITLASSTKISKITPATASALKVGADVTVMGPINQTVITAFLIDIDAAKSPAQEQTA